MTSAKKLNLCTEWSRKK